MADQTLPKINLELKRIEYGGEVLFAIMEVEENHPERFSSFAVGGHPGKFPQAAAVQWLIHVWNLSHNLAMDIVQNQITRAWDKTTRPPETSLSDRLDFVRDTLPDPDAVDEALARDVAVEEEIQQHLREMAGTGNPVPEYRTAHAWCTKCNTFRDGDGNCICP